MICPYNCNNIIQEGNTALMSAKERWRPNNDIIQVLEEAVRNAAVSSEQVIIFCML